MIQINVTAKCESITQRGTKCTKEAKVYEPSHSYDIDTNTVRVTNEGGRHSSFDSIPMGFRCNTHSREGRAEGNRRWALNHFRRTRARMGGINTI